MKKTLVRPSWYDDEFYNKKRVPEEWLFELWKRHQFKQNKFGLPHSIDILPIEEQKKYFIKFIFDPQIEKAINGLLEANPPQPIKHPSVSDIFIMYHLLTNSDWYKNNPHRGAFESGISTITNEGTLSKEQQIAFLEMYNTPWCVFYENGRVSLSTDELVNPDDDIAHSIDLANQVIDKSVISSLITMCEARKFKKETTTT